MEYLLNIKSNAKHATLEHLIRRYDTAQDMTRSAIFWRAVLAAINVEDWTAVQDSLAGLKEQEGVRVVTSFQAKYDDSTKQLLDDVSKKMYEDLKAAGRIKILQAQYMLLLLLANYLRKLKEVQKHSLEADGMAEEGDVGLADIPKILIDMIFEDPKCDELDNIRSILIRWRKKQKEKEYLSLEYDWREQIVALHTTDPIERHFIYQAVIIAKDGPEHTKDVQAYAAAWSVYLQNSVLDKTPGVEADNSPLLLELLSPLFGTIGPDVGLDMINSVNTTLNQMFFPSMKALGLSKQISKRKLVRVFVENRRALESAISDNLRDCLCVFLRVAYTVGNFMACPKCCNGSRGMGLTKDYLDLALWCIRSWYLAAGDTDCRSVYLELLLSGKRYDKQEKDEYLAERGILVNRYACWLSSFGDGPEGWQNFVSSNFLEPLLLEDKSPRPLWEGHIAAFEAFTADAVHNGTLDYEAFVTLQKQAVGLLPKDDGEISEFFTNAARAIQARSKLILDALKEREN